MSSRFSRPMTVQKPPKVCKHPPKKVPGVDEHYSSRPLSAVVKWFKKEPPAPISGTWFFCLVPDPVNHVHSGLSNPGRFTVDLTLDTDPDIGLIEIEIILFDGDDQLALASTPWIRPRAIAPFDTGFIDIQRFSKVHYVQAAIML